jgi:hypothetical protein
MARRRSSLGSDDPDVAAALELCACLTASPLRKSSELEAAWVGLRRLAIDERLPVRLGTVEAIVALCAHSGQADALVARAQGWLQNDEDREVQFASAAAVLAVLAQPSVQSSLREHDAMLEYVSGVLALIADAPRSAERSDARRRALRFLPDALCAIMSRMARVDGERAAAWLGAECEQASQRQIREALSETVIRLQRDTQGVGRATTERLRAALEASAAPLRDGVVIRPGTGRGKSTRRIR